MKNYTPFEALETFLFTPGETTTASTVRGHGLEAYDDDVIIAILLRFFWHRMLAITLPRLWHDMTHVDYILLDYKRYYLIIFVCSGLELSSFFQ